MYLWHIPALYDAAAENPLLHVLEHVSFFAAGLALWWPLIQPVPMRRRMTGLQPLGYIAAAKGGLAALGLFLAWSSHAALPLLRGHAADLGAQPVEDQNVAGVIMMVEQSMTLVLVLVWLFVRMLGRVRGRGAPARACWRRLKFARRTSMWWAPAPDLTRPRQTCPRPSLPVDPVGGRNWSTQRAHRLSRQRLLG